MPTHDETDQFKKDWDGLSSDAQREFARALSKFIEDLERPPPRTFRRGLRVKPMQAANGIFEMSWAKDGRATFEYGDEMTEGDPHIIWRRVGTHGIFGRP